MSNDYLINIKILIIQENPFMRGIMRRVLAQFGVRELREASDGADAMDLMVGFNPDICIIGWQMEPIDGMEFTKWIREGSDTPNPYMPLIMVSAHSEQHRVTEARDAGINEFLVKPLSAKSLMTRVQMVIERPRAFVRVKSYFGPDRRRRDISFKGPERRSDRDSNTDDQAAKEAGPDEQAAAEVKSEG